MRRAPASFNCLRNAPWLALLVAAVVLCAPHRAQAQTVCAVPGKDGVPSGSLSGVINTYYPGTANANANATSISVGTPTGDLTKSIQIGDLLLVIQMQDAQANWTNSSSYGDANGSDTLARGYTLANGTGRYEYVVATGAVGGGFVNIRGANGGGLVYNYTNTDYVAGTQGQRRFQVVRVPQYSSATLGAGLTAAYWNGTTGGILAFDVAGTLTLTGGSINVNGRGFRGGGGRDLDGINSSGSVANTDWRTNATNAYNGSKGEGIAGTPRYVYNQQTGLVDPMTNEGYPNGSNARGAPGNAGGGGTDGNPDGGAGATNDQNSGGGGGGNGGPGGIGGNTWSTNLLRGGYGGAQFAEYAADRVVMGGGGGAGVRNNSTGADSSGGAGGGIVMIRTGTFSGSATISANGADGDAPENDGGGGGGAGGSVVLVSVNASVGASLTVNARGGDGGDVLNEQGSGPHGPGGGGGGGVVAYTNTTIAVGASTTGGTAGVTTTSPQGVYGAGNGTGGQTVPFSVSFGPGASAGAQCIPVLAVTKTTSTANVTNTASGTTATYTITVTNAANRAPATSLSISDALPSGFTYASTTSVLPSGGATRDSISNPAVGATNPSWGVFTIPGSGQVRIIFVVNISRSVVTGTYQNPATATYLDPARTTTNGTTLASYNPATSAGEDVNVTSTPDLTIAKSHTGNFTQGQANATYTIRVTNSGAGQTSGTVTVTDTLPAGLTPTGWSSPPGSGWSCNIVVPTVTCTNSNALVAPNSYSDITITVSVSATAPASVTNTASVSGGGETNTGNNSSSDPTTINQLPDMTVAKTHTGNFTRGLSGTYTITATNSGAVAVTAGNTVTVTDTLPAGLTPTGWSSPPGSGWSCNIVVPTVTCTNSNALPATQSYLPISITVSVAQNAASSLTNTASVSGGGQINTANDTSSDPTTIVSSADLSLTKVTNNSGSGVGTNATFTVTLTNSGPSDATGVAVRDQLPAGLTYISSTPSVGSYNSGTGIWTVGNLASGATPPTLQIVARIDTLGSLTNTAEVSASGQPDPDSTPNNNNAAEDDQASASLSTSPPNVTLCKTVQGQPCPPVAALNMPPGSDITYVITFTNSGGSFASGFVISDQVPANTDFKVGSESHTTPLPPGLTGVTVEYFDSSTSTWITNPPSGGGGAPAGYNRDVTIVRWTFGGNLSQTAPNNTGYVGFTVRIR